MIYALVGAITLFTFIGCIIQLDRKEPYTKPIIIWAIITPLVWSFNYISVIAKDEEQILYYMYNDSREINPDAPVSKLDNLVYVKVIKPTFSFFVNLAYNFGTIQNRAWDLAFSHYEYVLIGLGLVGLELYLRSKK